MIQAFFQARLCRWRSSIAVLLTCYLATLACQAPPSQGLHEQAKGSHAQDKAPVGQRIASATLLGDEVLWNLGPEIRARVVAVSALSDDPRYSSVAGLWPADRPRLAANIEDYLVRQVDLAIVANFTDASVKQALKDRVKLIDLDDFSGHEAYLRHLEQIGATLGASAQAKQLHEAFNQQRRALEHQRDNDAALLVEAFGRKPRCLSWNYDHSPGKKTTFDDAAQLAGCDNVTAQAGLVGHQRVDAENVVAWDVDAFVLACEPQESCNEVAQRFALRPGLDKVAAIAARQFAVVPSPLLSTTGASQLDLAKELHNALLGLAKQRLSGKAR